MYIYKAMHSGLSASEEAQALGESVLEVDGSPKSMLAVKFKEQIAELAMPDVQEGPYWADLPPRERCKHEWEDVTQARVGCTCDCAPKFLHPSSPCLLAC